MPNPLSELVGIQYGVAQVFKGFGKREAVFFEEPFGTSAGELPVFSSGFESRHGDYVVVSDVRWNTGCQIKRDPMSQSLDRVTNPAARSVRDKADLFLFADG